LPSAVAVDSSGNLYIADTGNNRIRFVAASTGVISTIAGTGTSGFSGDGFAATSAELASPSGIAVDSSGNVYISDFYNDRIREIFALTGVINTIAGGGSVCGSATDSVGDNCTATDAVLAEPEGIRLDASGNLYIADASDQLVRLVTASTGIISSIAGNGIPGFSGDGASATSAKLNGPVGVGIDSSGNIWIADVNNARIREVSVSTGYINTVAGGGSYPSCVGETDSYGDNCTATLARLSNPEDVTVDTSGNMYFADYSFAAVREIPTSSTTVYGYAGNLNYSSPCAGATDAVGDGCLALNDGASLANPVGIGLDSSNNLYIADWGGRIRVVGH
jgi:sugar lactone lactonase YvrE